MYPDAAKDGIYILSDNKKHGTDWIRCDRTAGITRCDI